MRNLYKELLDLRKQGHLCEKWRVSDREKAQREGWDIFTTDRSEFDRFDIEALDEPLPKGHAFNGDDADSQAWLFVVIGALTGNQHHVRALLFLLVNSPIELSRILSTAHERGMIAEPEVALGVHVELGAYVTPMITSKLHVSEHPTRDLERAVVDLIEEQIKDVGGLREWLRDHIDLSVETIEMREP